MKLLGNFERNYENFEIVKIFQTPLDGESLICSPTANAEGTLESVTKNRPKLQIPSVAFLSGCSSLLLPLITR